MTEQATHARAGLVVEKLAEAVSTLDLDKIKALVHPDLVVIEPESLPYGGVYRGAEAFFTQVMPALAGPFELRLEGATIFERDTAAAMRATIVFTSRRTGIAIHMPYVEVYSVEDGLITQIDVYPQDVTALTQFMERER